MQTFLIAVDGSARASGVFNVAASLARALGARAVLYRALELSPDFTPAGARERDPLPAYLEGNARAQLMSLAATAADVACEIRVEVAAEPWRAILAAAKAAHADLIVLGSHGYHGWDHVLGTTAGKVANRAHRNVFIVHAHVPEAIVTQQE